MILAVNQTEIIPAQNISSKYMMIVLFTNYWDTIF